MNIFLFNKSLRCIDNTTLIYQMKEQTDIVPIFIFTEQVNKHNEYYNSNSIQFMIESLKELHTDISKKYNGELYFFHSNNLIDVFENLIKLKEIKSIGSNFDYSPYAKQRQLNLFKFCEKNSIIFYIKEDHVLYNILDGNTLKKDGSPYTMFTPYKNYCIKNLKITDIDPFKKFIFKKYNILKQSKYYISFSDIDKFYTYNEYNHVSGGRHNALKILHSASQFNKYEENRDCLTYNTTFLAAYNHFGVISIREVYKAFEKNKGLINELIWRDFYYNVYYYFPHMLEGQINKENKPFKKQFIHIKWNKDENLFNKWCNGLLGIPICDAGMRQLNKYGFMHNRLRMICASILTKILLIPWMWGEKYFAKKLVDYDSIQNSGGWAWTCHGIDPQQPYRIFSPKLQSKKYDPNTIFIKSYVEELESVPPEDIHNWETSYIKYKNIKYPPPQIDYAIERKKGIAEYLKVRKYK